jgi:hypothetical protein
MIFEVFVVVTILMMFFWFGHCVDWLVEASTNQSTQYTNPEEHHQ